MRLMPTNYAVVFEACARVERWQISGEPFEEVWTDGATCAATAVNGAAAVTLVDRAAQVRRIRTAESERIRLIPPRTQKGRFWSCAASLRCSSPPTSSSSS